MSAIETLAFQAETSSLLDLVVHSLYTQRDVFLRELIANASDALDRLRFETLLHPELATDAGAPEITLHADAAARTLTVRDNGIGMTREEVVSHIGTIARSGTKALVGQLEVQAGAPAADLIGRFGVGFYSAFMVADRVTLVTRRAGDPRATRWESSGDVEYTIADEPDAPPGTAVTLHLKAVEPQEGGIEEYTDRWVLARIVKRYADFVTYPIVYVGPAEPAAPGEPAPAPGPTRIVLNSMKPIWTRPEADVAPEEFTEFYKHIADDWNEPLLRMAFRAEGRWEYSTLLFVPSHAPYNLHYHAVPYGLQLYSRRMLIAANCHELLPRYLRFLKGVVDASDLPLNVSRQSLQDAHHLTQIRKWLTRKVLDTLGTLRDGDRAQYLGVWREFGRALKEGVSEDYENKSRLLPLMLFESSGDPVELTSLADYVSRMKPDQKDIYYLSGETRAGIERSPHLEEFAARGYEILYFTEPVDELLAQSVGEFEGHRLRSVAKGHVELGDAAERERLERELKEQTEQLRELLAFVGTHLESQVRQVRLSQRLTLSPACLTGEEYELSPHIERLLERGKGAGPAQKRVLELNPKHPIVLGLQARFQADRADPLLATTADLLLGLAVLAEGSQLADPVTFNGQLSRLLTHALGHVPEGS